MGVAHHGHRSIFGSMLGLGRTTGRTDSAEFGCRPSPTGRVHRHPEPLSPSEDAIDRFRIDSQDRGCPGVPPKCSPGPFGARWDGMSHSTDHPEDARIWAPVTGCGQRQLIETNECLKNRRLVDVRGVMVLGVAGITEPVKITLGELDLLPVCEPPEIRCPPRSGQTMKRSIRSRRICVSFWG
jgi:hypothetical protein